MMPSTSGGSIKELLDQAKPTNDPVMHPHHYSRWKMEAIEFIAINNLCWWLANVIKYCMRYDAKDGLQDLYKARSYLDMQIRLLEGHPRFWEKPVREQRELSNPRLVIKGSREHDQLSKCAKLECTTCPRDWCVGFDVPRITMCACGVNVSSPGWQCDASLRGTPCRAPRSMP